MKKTIKYLKTMNIKILISIVLGWICFMWAAIPQIVDQAYDLYILWGISLPILVSMAWGWHCGIVSCVLGLAMFSPFQAMERNGFTNFVTAMFLLLVIVGHGWCQENYQKEKSLFYQNHIFHIIYLILYLLCNPFLIQTIAPLNVEYWKEGYAYGYIPSNVIKVNQIVTLEVITIFVFGIRMLLSIDLVQNCFAIKNKKKCSGVSGIILGTIIVAASVSMFNMGNFYNNSISFGLISSSFQQTISLYQVTLLKIAIVVFIGDFMLEFLQYKEMIQEEKKESMERYLNIYENIFDMYIEFDETGQIVDVSPSACLVFHMSWEHMLNSKITDFLPYQSAQKKFMKKVLKMVSMKDKEIIMCRPDYSYITILVSSLSKVQENRYVLVARDITEYKKSVEERAELRATQKAVFEACDDLIWTVDGATGRMMNGNEACIQYFSEKWNTEISPGKNFLDHCTDEDEQNEWKKYYWHAKKEGKYTTEYVDTENDRIFELRLYLLEINDYKYNISIFAKDITEEKKVAIRMQQINEELEMRVRDRTKEMQKAYDELESFSYVVSHEVKTPIRAIDAYNNMIIEDSMDVLSEDGKEAVQGIHNFCKNALNMIEGILLHSKANVKTMQMESINMNEMVREVCREFNYINESKHLEIQVADLPEVLGDRVLLKQVILNIISNSVKYSSKKEEIVINIGCMQDEMKYTFYFRDYGAGFDSKYSDRIFQMFQRVHTMEEFEGNGIGLATMKKIIEKHGGEVFIFAKVEEGCVTGFTIPRKI